MIWIGIKFSDCWGHIGGIDDEAILLKSILYNKDALDVLSRHYSVDDLCIVTAADETAAIKATKEEFKNRSYSL